MRRCPDNIPPLALYRSATRSLRPPPPIVQVNVMRCFAVILVVSIKKKKRKKIQGLNIAFKRAVGSLSFQKYFLIWGSSTTRGENTRIVFRHHQQIQKKSLSHLANLPPLTCPPLPSTRYSFHPPPVRGQCVSDVQGQFQK